MKDIHKKLFILTIFLFSCGKNIEYKIIEFYSNGEKKEVNIFESEHLVSKIIYDNSGDLLRREEFFLNTIYGIWTPLYEKEDMTINYYGNGFKRSEGSMRNGNLDGRWSYYNRLGNIEKELYFNNGEPEGCWIEYENDHIIVEIYDYGLIKGTGNWVEYYRNNEMKKKINFKNNFLHGDYIEYHVNGNIKISGKYLNGKKDDAWVWYSDKGKKLKIQTYDVGMLDGPLEIFHSSLQNKLKGEYKNNLRNGNWIWYNQKGDITHSQQY